MIRMKRKDKEAWLKALREETYPKGTGALRDEKGGYCCIGVLQMVLDGKVETNTYGIIRQMPSLDWWEKNGITNPDDDLACRIVDGLEAPRDVTKLKYSFIPEINDNLPLTFPEMAEILDPIIEVYDEA